MLGSYLAAIDLEPAPPTMTLLSELTRRHLERFPFASVGPQLGDPLPK